MVRNRNPNQKPVAGGRELSGAEKDKKRKLELTQQQKLAEESSKVFKKFLVRVPSNSDIDPISELDKEKSDVSTPSNQITANEPGDKNEAPRHDLAVLSEPEDNWDILDPSTWHNPLTSEQKRELLLGPPDQKILLQYPKHGKVSFNPSNYRKSASGSERKWLLYSKKTNSLFCYSCSLFPSHAPVATTQVSHSWTNYGKQRSGFQDFVHQSRAIRSHENSQCHFQSTIKWKEYTKLSTSGKTIDRSTEERFLKETSFWRQVLHGLFKATFFLARNNLAFQGSSKKIGEPGCGNFLSLVELLSIYYPPLALHVSRLRTNKVSYMSDKTQNEFIELLGSSVRTSILRNVKERKFFTIMFDATPDTSHKEQVSQVIRTVRITENGCSVDENFIDFIHFDQKTGLQISEMIVEKLATDGLDIANCRGQGYDNGSNMSGIYQGVQARIRELNPKASFVPCAAHSLNLVGQNAASKVLPAKLLMGQIQILFVFFSGSPWRWNKMKKHVKKTPKGQSSTRWSSRCEAVSVVAEEYEALLDSLSEILESDEVNAHTLADANSLITQISTFKFLLGIEIWNSILKRIDITTIALQKENISINEASHHLEGLLTWLNQFKEIGYSMAIEKTTAKAAKMDISVDSGFEYRTTRGRLPQRFRIGSDEPNIMSNQDRFKKDFFDAILTKLIEEFGERFASLYTLDNAFSFLWGQKLAVSDSKQQSEGVSNLCDLYGDDFEKETFLTEVSYLVSAVNPFLKEDVPMQKTMPIDILNLLVKFGLAEQFSNVVTALQIFLTLPVSVASNERSFSKLKLIKTVLRSTMSQDRLSNLSILSIEHEHASKMSFDKIIDDFASKKCRQVKID